MPIQILPGSPFLQGCFYGLAALIVVAAVIRRSVPRDCSADS